MQKKILGFSHHNHGGQLQVASLQYNIPLNDWIDLSTGINPFSYPLPEVPTSCWQRLPESNDGLEIAATKYYGSEYLLPVAGSQEAIQNLPLLRKARSKKNEKQGKQRVGIISPAYHSHQLAWHNAGHSTLELLSSEVEEQIAQLDVLIVVNPSNPTTELITIKTLQSWHQKLAKKGGWLIVDEAYMDATPTKSLITSKPETGLIVLRSIGKFFGLAGIRLGFVWAEKKLLQQLAELQDDWAVSHPARWAGKIALQDTEWQNTQRNILKKTSQRLKLLLETHFQDSVTKINSTSLFVYLSHPQATHIHQQLAKKGILTRVFKGSSNYLSHPAIRIGLPTKVRHWELFETLLKGISVIGVQTK